jgi:hypothetical protein
MIVKSRFLASLEMTKGDFKEDKWKRLETPTQRSGFAFARLHAGLTVESQEVVLVETRAADR